MVRNRLCGDQTHRVEVEFLAYFLLILMSLLFVGVKSSYLRHMNVMNHMFIRTENNTPYY